MNSRERKSREIARILDRTAANAFTVTLEEVEAAFSEAESACFFLVSSDELEQEVRRRVAEWKLKIYCDRDAALSVVSDLYENASTLGFSSLENEGVIAIYFAQYCIRAGHPEAAKQALHLLCGKLDEAIQSHNLEVYHRLNEEARNLLSRTLD